MTDKEWNDAFAAANPDCWIHDLATGEIIPPLTMRNNDIDDLCPSDFQDPWPPSDEEIEERERQAEWEDLQRSIPDAAERNRNLK
jgi:hypothetical protein